MGTPALGVFATLGFGTTSTVDKPLEFLDESLRKQGRIHDPSGIRGTRSHNAARTRNGVYVVSGGITCEPAPDELANLLPWILGANASGTTFALAETLQERYVSVDRQTKVFTYANVKVARAVFESSEGNPLKLTLELIGKTESVGNSGTMPALTLTTLAPYMFHDLTFTIGGVTYQSKNVQITIDNHLSPRYLNSQSATAINETDRTVSVSFLAPYTTTEVGLYDTGATGAAVNATFTNGGVSCLFAFADVQFPAESPTVRSKDEVFLSLNGIARQSGANKEIVVTNDSTP